MKVTNLLRYDTFHDLFTCNDLSKFGGVGIAQLKDQIDAIYSCERQRENGVVGIEFELIRCDSSK